MLTRVQLFGMEFASGELSSVVAEVDALIRQRSQIVITPVNVDVLVQALKEPRGDLVTACRQSDLVLPDGLPLVWASRFLGRPMPARVAGVDLMVALCGHASQRGQSVFLLGAAPGVGERAAEVLKKQLPGLIVSTYCPPQGFEQSTSGNDRALQTVRKAKPRFLFVALGAPKQEKWIKRWRGELEASAIMAVGGSLDIVAGDRRRAPRWMRGIGLEWLWRLALEPRRLWRRYLIDDVSFIKYVLQEWRVTK